MFVHDELNELKLNKLSQVAHASVSTLCVAPEFETFFQVNLLSHSEYNQ